MRGILRIGAAVAVLATSPVTVTTMSAPAMAWDPYSATCGWGTEPCGNGNAEAHYLRGQNARNVEDARKGCCLTNQSLIIQSIGSQTVTNIEGDNNAVSGSSNNSGGVSTQGQISRGGGGDNVSFPRPGK